MAYLPEVLLPSCVKVMSFSSKGMKGTTGGWSFPTLTLYARHRVPIIDSNSVKSFRNFDGSLSQVLDRRDTATLLNPITMAQNAFRFWNSLQLKFILDSDPFAQAAHHADFGYDPELNFVETSQKYIQIRCNLSEVMSSECMINFALSIILQSSVDVSI
ncbi:hypothetical protein HUJ05_008002 [Dendroctonus ponderosae]|nr:hypothetical protein HUJ05_008002 [Dendroctonus ponderosae]